jgi:ketosteroid isomerase-like protein
MFRTILKILFMFGATHVLAASAPSPQDLADSWTLAYNAHNPAGLAELYDPNSILMLHGSLTLRGRQAIHDYWVEDFREGNPITTLSVTHAVEGVDMMLVHGNYLVIERNDGTLLGQGRYAHIWLRDGSGNWLLDRDMWNEPFEPYGP